jgi:hypothetical protein
MNLSENVLQRFRDWGKQGGDTRARKLDAAHRSSVARRAAVDRWNRVRFGSHSFEALRLPGGEIIDRGIADALAGIDSPEALLLAVAAPRLRREGVSLPRSLADDPESRLYRALSEASPGLAHARYLAYLRQATSFADACRSRRVR